MILEAGGVDGARDTSSRLIREHGSLAAVLSAPSAQLRAAAGSQGVEAIRFFRSAMTHVLRSKVVARPILDNQRALEAYLRTMMTRRTTEQVRILYLDGRNRLIAEHTQEGTVDMAPVYPREVIRRALEAGASNLILVHNHPSGDPTPTGADITVTRAIADAARIFGISVHDHLILADGPIYSMREAGLL